jgi:hypothetical protein
VRGFVFIGEIVYATSVNALPDRKFKVVAYKCKTCYKFHVGRNGNTITDKEKQKWKSISKASRNLKR